MESRAAVVMFLYNDATHDSRVLREASTLASAGWDVVIIAVQPGGLLADERRMGARILRVGNRDASVDPSPFWLRRSGPWLARIAWLARYIRRYWTWYRSAVQTARRLGVAPNVIWVGHDLTGLLPASRAAKPSEPLVYDSHELYLEAASVGRLPWPLRSILRRLERTLSRRATAVMTVGQALADELVRRYGIERPTVVMNCPPLGHPPAPKLESPLRKSLGLGGRPVLLHHGVISENRGIRPTIAALHYLPSDVALVLLGNGELVKELGELAAGPLQGRLFLHAAVPIGELPEWISGADVSVVAIEPANLSYRLSVPNKLFESLAAGVPVVVSDFPEMRSVAVPAAVGIAADPLDPQSIASAVAALLAEDDQADLRTRCRTLAVDCYSWERESEKLLALFDRLTRRAGLAQAPP